VKDFSKSRYAALISRGLNNILTKKPLSISFEITHQCSADCNHCNWGGRVDEVKLTPKEYAEICRDLKPVIAHLSGGEPTLRTDIIDIIAEMSNPKGWPVTQIITHGAKLSFKRYEEFKAAGLDRVCISLDFPDERHDEWRHIPGLFEKLSTNLPKIASLKLRDINMNTCITADNVHDLPDILRLANSWGIPVNFSAYTPLRTDDTTFSIKDKKNLGEVLTESIKELISMKRAGYAMITSEVQLMKYKQYLLHGTSGKCQAGYRFLVIQPNGRFTPCAMIPKYFRSKDQMIREFSKTNDCQGCFIATRAETEKTPAEFIKDLGSYVWGKSSKLGDPMHKETLQAVA